MGNLLFSNGLIKNEFRNKQKFQKMKIALKTGSYCCNLLFYKNIYCGLRHRSLFRTPLERTWNWEPQTRKEKKATALG